MEKDKLDEKACIVYDATISQMIKLELKVCEGMYIAGSVGATLIADTLSRVPEEEVGRMLDDLIGMIKQQVREIHPSLILK